MCQTLQLQSLSVNYLASREIIPLHASTPAVITLKHIPLTPALSTLNLPKSLQMTSFKSSEPLLTVLLPQSPSYP